MPARPPSPRSSLLPAAPTRLAVTEGPPPDVGGVGIWSLVALVVALLAADFVWPLRGVLSYGIVGAVTLLTLPWIWLFLRGDASEGAPPGASALASRAFQGLAALLMFAFLVAKWLLLSRSDGTDALAASSRSYALAIGLVFTLGTLGRGLRFSRFVAFAADHPARLLALWFSVAGLLGGLLLSLPFSAARVEDVSLIDNLFMAFSAVCVTGLAVNAVSETYSVAGQVVLCALVQIGGLGIMVLSAALGVLSGRRMRVKSSAVLAEMVDARSVASLRRTVFTIVTYVLLIQAAGATLLYLDFRGRPELTSQFGIELDGPLGAAWVAIFHAVSAFCNAGFSNVEAGLVPTLASPIVATIIALLVLLGGIGFPVLEELMRALFTKLRGRRVPVLSLNTRIALRASAILLVSVALFYLLLESRASMANLSVPERIGAALFQSVSARSSGFSVVDLGLMTPAALMLTCAAMFIGASPGGTGGGIKTTTLAALYAGLRAELFARPPRLLDRALPQNVIRRAIGVAFLSMTLLFSGFFLLLLVEPHPPLALAFEAVSAFTTTGLSTGITPELSVPGKLLLALMMFIGRIGPLTLALALATTARQRELALPEERLMIG